MQDTNNGREIEPTKYKTRPTFAPKTLADELADLRRIRGRAYYDNLPDTDDDDDDE